MIVAQMETENLNTWVVSYNMEVMLGSAILRADMKGVAALVQTWVS
jgi:hypothetical protein